MQMVFADFYIYKMLFYLTIYISIYIPLLFCTIYIPLYFSKSNRKKYFAYIFSCNLTFICSKIKLKSNHFFFVTTLLAPYPWSLPPVLWDEYGCGGQYNNAMWAHIQRYQNTALEKP